MPCEICKTNVVRSYTHSRNTYHLKELKKKFMEYKKNNNSPYEPPKLNIPAWAL